MFAIITSPCSTYVGLLIVMFVLPVIDVVVETPLWAICPKEADTKIKFAATAKLRKKVNFFMLKVLIVK